MGNFYILAFAMMIFLAVGYVITLGIEQYAFEQVRREAMQDRGQPYE